MKSIKAILGAVSILCLLLIFACQQQDLRTDRYFPDGKVMTRSATCNDCDDCCCSVQLDGDDAAILHLCGTANGPSACMGTDSCLTTFSGGGQFLTLSTSNPKEIFCMDDAGQFWVMNFSMSDDADFILSCDEDSGTPISVHLEPGAIQYFQTTSSGCEILDCPY